jgi:hypothetical protein
MTSTGMRPPPDPNDPADIEPRSDVESVPDEEEIDPASVEEDLEKEPEEKRNATDGYAPADDGDVDTAKLDELD